MSEQLLLPINYTLSDNHMIILQANEAVECGEFIKEINGRLTCTRCGYEWSAMLGDDEWPDKCGCETESRDRNQLEVTPNV